MVDDEQRARFRMQASDAHHVEIDFEPPAESDDARHVEIRVETEPEPDLESEGSPLSCEVACVICLEMEVGTRCILGCGHSFCAECLSTFVGSSVREGRVDVRCPYWLDEEDAPCGVALDEDELLHTLADDDYERFLRFFRRAADPAATECPGCGAFFSAADKDDCTCPVCFLVFCREHGTSHAPGPASCARYERRLARKHAREERRSRLRVLESTKPCPGCGIHTEKTMGCNHMRCVRCSVDWCWLCGAGIELSGPDIEHFATDGGSGCAGMQFAATRRSDAAPVLELPRCVTLIGKVALILLAVPLAVLWAVAVGAYAAFIKCVPRRCHAIVRSVALTSIMVFLVLRVLLVIKASSGVDWLMVLLAFSSLPWVLLNSHFFGVAPDEIWRGALLPCFAIYVVGELPEFMNPLDPRPPRIGGAWRPRRRRDAASPMAAARAHFLLDDDGGGGGDGL